ncbi:MULTISPECIES: hypothetical protein [unclassified Methylobacterium]|nr:hypothetical protein [Methylobacterium sp. 2A]
MAIIAVGTATVGAAPDDPAASLLREAATGLTPFVQAAMGRAAAA